MYTNTPDEHFIIDLHPEHPAVIIASPCSGHGFKFSIAIGELIADEFTGERRRFDLTPFRIDRFAHA
jgi:sarcosine oxidase